MPLFNYKVKNTAGETLTGAIETENEEQAVVWRGPLMGRAIKQFWTDTLWDTLD